MKSDVQFISEEKRLRPKKSEIFRLWGDNSLIFEFTGFRPQITLEEVFKETVKLYLIDQSLWRFKTKLYNI